MVVIVDSTVDVAVEDQDPVIVLVTVITRPFASVIVERVSPVIMDAEVETSEAGPVESVAVAVVDDAEDEVSEATVAWADDEETVDTDDDLPQETVTIFGPVLLLLLPKDVLNASEEVDDEMIDEGATVIVAPVEVVEESVVANELDVAVDKLVSELEAVLAGAIDDDDELGLEDDETELVDALDESVDEDVVLFWVSLVETTASLVMKLVMVTFWQVPEADVESVLELKDVESEVDVKVESVNVEDSEVDVDSGATETADEVEVDDVVLSSKVEVATEDSGATTTVLEFAFEEESSVVVMGAESLSDVIVEDDIGIQVSAD